MVRSDSDGQQRRAGIADRGDLGLGQDRQRGEIDLNELCDRFPSFYRYSKILENFADAMQAGAFADLGFGKRQSN